MRSPSPAKILAGVLFALGLAIAGEARAADVPITEEARTHFAAGVALLQDPKAPRYEDAYREFKAAYAASPSYKILGNLSLCAMKIERDAEAIDAMEKYLKEAGPELSPPERDQAQRDLLTLKAGVVNITVSSDPPGASIIDVRAPIDGTDIRNAYGEAKAPLVLGIRRGHHVITARLAGYVDQQWEFEASGTTLPPHVFTMIRPAQPGAAVLPVIPPQATLTRPIPTAAYISGAVTLGLAATGAVIGMAAIQKHNDYGTVNDGQHVSQASSDRSSGQTLNGIADGFFGAAVVGAALTTYFVLARPTVERPVTTGALPHLTAAPTWGASGVGGGLSAVWVY
ncbi:MAG TPA: hypothetical protein VIF09_01765 [Polyangiaceae bacterium]